MTLAPILQLIPEYRDYVWGGHRLRPDGSLTAEAWVVYENDRVASGAQAGRTLGELARDFGVELLGRAGMARMNRRFPLLIKLLDCAAWLSLQVHPGDELARRMEGPQFYGKTEAWHVLEAGQDAELIAGCKPGTSPAELEQAVRGGSIAEWVNRSSVRAGDTIYMPAGTIHALGPGLLIYEVQETSDLTYRVYDWGRPATPARPLHIEQSLAALDPALHTEPLALPRLVDAQPNVLVSSPYFTMATIQAQTQKVRLDCGDSFQAVTVIEGALEIQAGGQVCPLHKFETAVIPACAGEFSLQPLAGGYRLLKSSLEMMP